MRVFKRGLRAIETIAIAEIRGAKTPTAPMSSTTNRGRRTRRQGRNLKVLDSIRAGTIIDTLLASAQHPGCDRPLVGGGDGIDQLACLKGKRVIKS
jgi:hypothetical protein